ncbi:hypothetical protein [Kocuria sp. CH-021]|uniref:hypothetical protein n=1 Tax=Kocuria sp. CH-021 TaxID=3406735 RepID=UPI003C741676
MDVQVGPVPPERPRPAPRAPNGTSPTAPAGPRPAARADAQQREVRAALSRRTAPLWPAHAPVRPAPGATPQDRRQVRRLAGLEIQHHALVLRRISTAGVVAVAEPCFDAGWTVADVLHALDWTPQGARYAHDSVTGIENPGAWFAARLRTWTHQDGTPMRSADQRAAAEAEQRRAEALAAARRHADRRPRQEGPGTDTAATDTGATDSGATDAAVDPPGTAAPDPRPFRVRWAAQIAAGRAERERQDGRDRDPDRPRRGTASAAPVPRSTGSVRAAGPPS